MGFINAILDEEVAYGFEGGPEYSTDITALENGLENRNSAWAYPRHKYDAEFDNLQDDARSAIIRVFHAVRGKRHAFKFKDWNDYTSDASPLSVPPSFIGTLLPVQLYKTYIFGEAYTIRPIQAIESATVYLAGTAVAGTIDTELGMFYPSSAWVDGAYTWSGEFYVWVRFDADYNSFTVNNWQSSTAKVSLLEDKRKITATNVPDSWEE